MKERCFFKKWLSIKGVTGLPAFGRILGTILLAVLFMASMPVNVLNANTWDGIPGPNDLRRHGHAMAANPNNNNIYMFGGRGESGVTDEFKVWTGTEWQTVPKQTTWPEARIHHAMAIKSDGTLVLFGGVDAGGAYLANSIWQWNGSAWTETAAPGTGDWPESRKEHAMVYDASSGNIVIFGGTSDNTKFIDELWTWDGSTMAEKSTNNNWPAGRYGHAMAYDEDQGNVVLFGGYGKRNGNGNAGENKYDTWTWDGVNEEWDFKNLAVADSPSARFDHSMACDPVRNRVILFGGQNGSIYGDTWQWNGSAWSLVSASTPNLAARYNHALAYDGHNSAVLVFGGKEGNGQNTGNYFGDAWHFDGTTWNNATFWPLARMEHAIASDGNGKVYLFGGVAGNGNAEEYNDLWEWDGTKWLQHKPASPTADWPEGRKGHALIYDTNDNRLILYGGISGKGQSRTVYDDTWRWNGAAWTRVSTSGPGGRYGHSMVYDPNRDRVVLFGGMVDKNLGNDTWEWDGGNWSNVTPGSANPAARQYAAMAYDTVQKRMLLFGGFDGSAALSDFHAWNGSAWAPISETGPVAQTGHGMAFDTLRGVLILFGTNVDGSAGATWEYGLFSGTTATWQEIFPTQSPSLRSYFPMVYHVSQGKVMLFGGKSGKVQNDVWYYSLNNAPPVIVHTPITTAVETYDLPITATITDPDGDTVTARVVYQSVGTGGLPVSIDMTASGDTYTATIPAAHVSQTELVYTIVASDGTYLNVTHGPHTVAVGPAVGRVIVDITSLPSDSDVDANATWTISGLKRNGEAYTLSGTGDADIADFPAGTYTIAFGDITGWQTPAPQPFILDHLGEVTLTCQYLINQGQLSVTVASVPVDGTFTSQASWTVSGTREDGKAHSETHQGSQVIPIPTGSYTVTFNTYAGWETPDPQSVTIGFGGLTEITGTYVQLPASLTVNIGPPEVVGTARWTVDGTNYHSSGATISLNAGSYQVTFNSVAGYQTPSPIDVTLNPGDAQTLTAQYVALPATLSVQITPPEVVANARWTVDGINYHVSGAAISLAAGSYQVTFNAVAGYQTPAPIDVTLGPGETRSLSANYAALPASLTVLTDPAEVVADARWTIDGVNFHTSGTTLSLAHGDYQVTFTDVAGYQTPAPIPVTLGPGGNVSVTGTYLALPATLTVNIEPAEVLADAQWTVDGVNFNAPGASISLAPGSYQVTFTAVSGYQAPAPISVLLGPGGSQTVTGTYLAQPASLTVLIEPTAVTPTARWTIDGSNFHTSGTTLSLPHGNYQVTFNDVAGYQKPAPIAVTLSPGESRTVTGTYQALNASLTVNITPPEVTGSAQWTVDNVNYNPSGATISVNPGTYTVSFTAVSGYSVPAPITVTLGPGETRTLSAAYQPLGANLTVNIGPAEVVGSAQWTVDNVNFYPSGHTQSLPAGSYTITFTDVAGYTKPAPVPITLNNGANETVTRNYTPNNGSLTVFINPDAVRGDARWTVNGVTRSHGETVSLSPGTYAVTFNDVAGYTKPGNLSVTVGPGQNVTRTVTYAPNNGSLTVNIDPTAVRGSARWTVNGVTRSHGETVSLSPGTYAVTFNDVAGYTKPGNLSVTIGPGQNVTRTVTYAPNNGSLTVNIDPAAVRGSARWTVNGVTRSHGETVSLSPGTYAVTFNDVAGYTKPGNLSVTIGPGQNVTRTVTYAPNNGSLTVNINPTAVRGSARWTVNGVTRSHGETVSLAPGTYAVTFNDVAGYTKPGNLSVTIGPGQNVTRTVTYTANPGSLTVNINPTAVRGSARWTVNGVTRSHGQTVSLPVGTYAVTFNDVTGYTKPANLSVTIGPGQNVTRTVTYTANPGSLTVNINPTAVRGSARWTVNGVTRSHGQTVSLPVGTYTVTFNNVTGYTKPANLSVTIGPGQSVTKTVAYSPNNGSLTVNINPIEVRGSARWTVNGVTKAHAQAVSLPPGTYTVTFNNVTGYTKPGSLSVTIGPGQIVTKTVSYTRQTGTLTVNINPVDVRTKATWSVTGFSGKKHGETVTLGTGTYTVTFSNVTGYHTPQPKTVTITNGQNTSITGSYVRMVGTLTVNITPTEVRSTATWSVTGFSNKKHGETVALGTGTYTVTFSDVTGFFKPAPMQVTITDTKNTAITGVYVHKIGTLIVNVTPSGAVSYGQWKAISTTTGYDSGWKTSGQRLTLLVGSYTIQYQSTLQRCWGPPRDKAITMTADATITENAVFYKTGNIKVVLATAYANAGGLWRQIRPGKPASEWRVSGYIDHYEPISDPYYVEYKSIPAYPSLPMDTVNLRHCETVTHYQTLNESTGTLQVGVEVDNALGSQDAPQWYLESEPGYKFTGNEEVTLDPGTYTVVFSPLPGWTQPVKQRVTVEASEVTEFNARYTQHMVIGANDFNGDGAADISLYRPSSGSWMVPDQPAVKFGNPEDIPVPGDYNGDGKTDVAYFNPASGLWKIQGSANVKFGEEGDIPTPADYDGDGITDISVYRPAEGKWLFHSVGQDIEFGSVVEAGIPIPMDYNGDGAAEITIYRPSEGKWYLLGGGKSSRINSEVLNIGAPGYIAVPGDYDGDGSVDPAVYDAANGKWYFNGSAAISFGQPGDIPAPGDYDGDGKTDIAVFRVKEGKWLIKGQFELEFGQKGDIPLVKGK